MQLVHCSVTIKFTVHNTGQSIIILLSFLEFDGIQRKLIEFSLFCINEKSAVLCNRLSLFMRTAESLYATECNKWRN